MADEPIETAAPEQETPASTTAPAIPTPQPDLETLKSAAKQEAQREAQSAKDREIARLHQQYQQRERALLAKVKGTLKASGFQEADQLEERLAAETELEEYRALRQQLAAQSESTRYGQGLVADIADVHEVKLDPNDARFWSEPFETWDAFKERVRLVAKDEVRKRREAEKTAEEAARRQGIDERVQSGELSTLGVVPAGAVKQDELAKYSPKNVADLYRLGASREREKETRQRK